MCASADQPAVIASVTLLRRPSVRQLALRRTVSVYSVWSVCKSVGQSSSSCSGARRPAVVRQSVESRQKVDSGRRPDRACPPATDRTRWTAADCSSTAQWRGADQAKHGSAVYPGPRLHVRTRGQAACFWHCPHSMRTAEQGL